MTTRTHPTPSRSLRGSGRTRTTVFERQPPAEALVDRALAPSVLRPFWLDEVPASQDSGAALTGHYDLLVVGGGYTGLWSALGAATSGRYPRVAVVESQTVGGAASGRNGGFVDASLTHGSSNGRRRWPSENDALVELGRRNLDAFAADVAAYGLDCEFERTGAVTVAVEPHQVDELAEAHAEGGGTLLDADEVRRELDSPTYLAGLASTDTALVHPGKLAAELARACRGHGVEIHENTPVTALPRTRAGEPIDVVTAGGTVTASRVILATNAFPTLLRRWRALTVPVWDHVLMTEPLSAGQLAAIGWSGRQGFSDSANQFHYYRLTRDHRILWGGYDAIYHARGRIDPRHEDRTATYRRLASHFFTTFPQLADVTFTHRWGGVIDTCSRFCPFVTSARGGRIAHAAGFTGLGVGATRFAAQVMLDRFAGESTERTESQMVGSLPLPFPPEPLAAVGINLTRWSLDRADHRQGRRNLWLRAMDAAGLGFDS